MSSGHVQHASDADLLDQRERRTLSIRMGLALGAAGLLALGTALETWWPAQTELGELVCAIAAVFATAPILRDAWRGLRAPSLHGATDLIVSAAVLAAWAIGDFKTHEANQGSQ